MRAFLRYGTAPLLLALVVAWQQGAFQRLRDPASLNGDTCGSKKFCLVVYLAPWCPHCKSSLSHTQALLQKSRFGDTGVRVVVGMSQGGDSQAMARRIATNVALDDEEVVAKKLAIHAVPAYVVLDADGAKIVDGQEGAEWAAEKFKL